MTDDSTEESYDIYCNEVNKYYSINISYDATALLVGVVATASFYATYIKFVQEKDDQAPQNIRMTSISGSPATSKKRSESRKTKPKPWKKEQFHRNIIICVIILSFYSATLFVKLLNHILCSLDPSLTRVTGLVFTSLYSSSLTFALSSFARRLKQSFGNTIHEPSNVLYGLIIGSTVLFISICFFTMFLFAFGNVIGKHVVEAIFPISLTIIFGLYVIVIGSTVGLFVSTLRKV